MKEEKKKSYMEMNTKELAEATAEFDKEFVAETFQEPTQSAKAAWQRAKRKPGRPKTGKGVTVISVSVEKGLLDRCDKLATKKGISRASLICRGLRAVLAAEEAQ